MKRAIVFWTLMAVGGALRAANGGYENGVDSAADAARGCGDYVTTAAKPTAAEAQTQRYAQCKRLLSLDLSAVSAIGDAAFAYSAMTNLTIPANVTSVGYISFGGCTNLESVTVRSWGWATATANLAAKEPFRGCTKLKTVVVEGDAAAAPPAGLEQIFPAATTVSCPAANVSAWKTAYPKIAVVETSGSTPEPEPAPEPEPEATPYLYEAVEDAAPDTAASVYDGYLYDRETGALAGTIQVKVGKPNKNGQASVKATVVGLDGRKKTLKAEEKGKAEIAENEPTTVPLVGGEPCEVTLGADALGGFYGAYAVDGARNFFTSKDKSEQSAANALLEPWLGAVNAAWDGGVVSVAVAKKGKAKATVTLADGTKATATSQLLVGGEWLCVPVVAAKKANLAFTLWLPRAGGKKAFAAGLGDGASVGQPIALKANAEFHVPKAAALWSQLAGAALTDYLPNGLSVAQSGTKWVVADGARAGKVIYQRGTDEVDESKLGANPSALKLTYKAKDGTFKGSFKVYADNGGKLKATTVSVVGVLVGDAARGVASVKKPAGAVGIWIGVEEDD